MTLLAHLHARLGTRYRVERELGRGGMGAVYLARDLRLDRPVALKVLPAEFAALPGLRERFLRETRTAAGFSHPNIVPVYAVEESEDLLAFAMGFVEGESLASRVARAGPLTVRESVKLLQDVAYALAYAHGRGVVHRDIKPDNIMIERATGRALVMDFGIARAITAAAPSAEGLTRVGEVVGTPEYMSPEQATGDTIDGRSDLYSLGLTAHYALTGSVAMSGDSVGRVLARQIAEVLPPMSTVRPDLPAPLADAIDRCLAKDPDDRFENAETLVETLDAAQLTTPDIPVPIRLFAQEASTLSMVLLGGVVLTGYVWRFAARAELSRLDTMLPLVLLFGVLLTRTLQTLSEARRLVRDGFSPGDVHRGLATVLAERQGRRIELRADERTRRSRRRTLWAAVLQLIIAAALFRLALEFRTPIGGGNYEVALPGVIMVFSTVALLGVSLVLLVRSPFRMPLGERVFRLVWLGPLGRWFIQLAGRGNARASANIAATQSRTGTPPAATPSKAASRSGDRLTVLEGRVAELERWRRGEANGGIEGVGG